jgi:hypothetical protein
MEWPRYFNNTSITGVTNNRTQAEHTEICSGKDRVRRDRIEELQSDKRKAQGVFTISDALLPMLYNLRHTGIVQCCDMDKAMCVSIDSHRPRPNKPEGNFPGLPIRPALHMDVREAVKHICMRGDERLFGLWDIDLTSGAKSLFTHIMPSILQDLADCRVRSRIVVTASARDYFRSWSERECYIRSVLPKGIEYITHDPYSSNYYTRNREYKRRAPMVQYILQGAPVTKAFAKAA